MPKKLLEQKNIIIAVVVIVLAVGGYFWYSSSSPATGATPTKPNPSLFNDNVRGFYLIKDSINLDNSFMTGNNQTFFSELKDYTQPIPLKEPTGRPNPFVPYATP